ncbi:hypothetical protein BBM38_16835 [Vibrio parahaemolyticus]|nr:hypothetical protein FORC72_2321 [Vibrio parahaemolyticus]ODZ32416.1 hypothetical protein BBM38_16835 [Vibrio parahaemolyticus]ODZ39661.1 hypothetical protein BBM37_06710 [Vibrio parahaemolyticus]OHX56718.1 hypothetical protein BBZ60_11620 [Vibrio parahaemolyticus]
MFSFKRNKESKNNQVLLRCTFRTLSAMKTTLEDKIHIVLSFYASTILSSCVLVIFFQDLPQAFAVSGFNYLLGITFHTNY